MPIINILDSLTINQIAAGEVIERPASIVKELLENSFDAQATAVTVEIKKGGKTFIRVTDNGIGMDKDDAAISFQPHATSKIKSAEDLDNVDSLGFRGEALASISSVSQIEMFTREKSSLEGHHIINHGGEIVKATEAGCPEGTTVIVRNLFYNVPARLKFLKSDRSESAYISDFVSKLILAHPKISIKYINNGNIIYNSLGNNDILSAIITIYGKDIRNNLIKVDAKDVNRKLNIFGYIGDSSLSRSNRNHQTFFVNGRYIKSRLLSQAIEDAAKSQTMINRFPWCVLNISLPPDEIDVNVHPSKIEIRFKKQQEVYNIVFDFLLNKYEDRPYIPKLFDNNLDLKETEDRNNIKSEQTSAFAYDAPIENGEDVNNNYINNYIEIASDSYNASSDNEYKPKDVFIKNEDKYDNNSLIDQTKTAIRNLDFLKMRIVGQLFSTYILLEYGNDFYIIDQHAAHERLIYEEFKSSIKSKKYNTQQLSPPYILELTHNEYIILSEHLSTFLNLGFELEGFGSNTFIIRGVPLLLKDINIKELFQDLLDQVDNNVNKSASIENDDIITAACKKAVKAHDNLNDKEIKQLLIDLSSENMPLTCPHGRPILIAINKYDLEKKFKRVQ